MKPKLRQPLLTTCSTVRTESVTFGMAFSALQSHCYTHWVIISQRHHRSKLHCTVNCLQTHADCTTAYNMQRRNPRAAMQTRSCTDLYTHRLFGSLHDVITQFDCIPKFIRDTFPALTALQPLLNPSITRYLKCPYKVFTNFQLQFWQWNSAT